jgi:D-alanine-D-alanine ligase-like ATP-grasp enzyme
VADCARTFGLTDFANAAFIVRACNAHDEMLEALEELDRLRVGCSPDELGAIAGKTVAAFVEQYRAAIAKATA